MSFLKEFLGKYPSSFITKLGSNNWKLSKFFTDGLDQTKDTLEQIDSYRNVDNAEGKALDKLGDKYGVKRGPADDEFYRMMIRSKIANRKGDTTVNGILRTMQNALGIDVKGVKIGPVYHNGKQEPLSLRLSNVPLSFARSEFEQEFMLKQIESIVAVGVRLQDLQFIVPISGKYAVGGGVATAYSFTLDDSKDYDFETYFKGIALGGSLDHTAIVSMDDSKDYNHQIVGNYFGGATSSNVTLVKTDDTKDYRHLVQGNASVGASSDGVATVEITDQFDERFEIKDKTKTGASVGALETYEIE